MTNPELAITVLDMPDAWTFEVTLIRPGGAAPSIEVGAYRYSGASLPHAGDTITITKATTLDTDQREELLAYVTRVEPGSQTPIRVTEVPTVIPR